MNINNKFYPLVLHDGGRNFSKRPRQTNDCTVRTLAIVCDLDYDSIYDRLAKAGRKPCDGFDLHNYIRYIRRLNGYTFNRIKFKDKKVIESIFEKHRSGKFIVETSDHVFALINGVAYDMIREPLHKEVTGLWEVYK